MQLRLRTVAKSTDAPRSARFAIVWISNQAGNSSQQLKFKNKMPLLCRVLDVPVRVLAAWGHDEYRKSSTGMWDALVRDFNGGVQVGALGWNLRARRLSRQCRSCLLTSRTGCSNPPTQITSSRSTSETPPVVPAITTTRTGVRRPSFRGLMSLPHHRINRSCPLTRSNGFLRRTELALNCGLKFLTPEEFFLNKPPMPFALKGWDPSTHDHDGQSSLYTMTRANTSSRSRWTARFGGKTDEEKSKRHLLRPAGPLFSPTSSPLLPRRNSEFEDEHPPEVVIFVGFPGSGKTSFYKTHFAPKGYVHVVRSPFARLLFFRGIYTDLWLWMLTLDPLQNQDTLRTRSACLDLVSSCLSSSPPKSCVVDNTSPSRSVRAEYVSLIRARYPGTKIRCFYFTAPMQLAMHNAVYRALCEPVDGGNGKMREVLPMIAFMTFRSNLEIPTPSEGEPASLLRG